MIGGRDQRAQVTAAAQRRRRHAEIVRRLRHVEKDRVDAVFVKSFRDILEFEFHAIGQPHPIEILAGQMLHFRPHFVGNHAPAGQRRARQRQRQSAGTAARFDDGDARLNRQSQQDVPDIFREDDLRGALDILNQIGGGRVEQQERVAQMGLHLAAPHAADAVVVLDHTAMRLQRIAGLQPHQVTLVVAADEQGSLVGLNKSIGHAPHYNA